MMKKMISSRPTIYFISNLYCPTKESYLCCEVTNNNNTIKQLKTLKALLIYTHTTQNTIKGLCDKSEENQTQRNRDEIMCHAVWGTNKFMVY